MNPTMALCNCLDRFGRRKRVDGQPDGRALQHATAANERGGGYSLIR